MSMGFLSSPIFDVILGVLCVAILTKIIRSPKFRGYIGEKYVSLLLHLLPRSRYRVVHDVTLETRRGTAQIDHIVVSRFGVFVIETKNMKGHIRAYPDERNWVQYLGRKKRSFYNPLLQNQRHVTHLSRILDISNDSLISVIIFVGDNRFKTSMPPNVKKGIRAIIYISSFKRAIYTQSEMEDILQRIESKRLERCSATNKAHIQHVNRVKRQKRSSA